MFRTKLQFFFFQFSIHDNTTVDWGNHTALPEQGGGLRYESEKCHDFTTVTRLLPCNLPTRAKEEGKGSLALCNTTNVISAAWLGSCLLGRIIFTFLVIRSVNSGGWGQRGKEGIQTRSKAHHRQKGLHFNSFVAAFTATPGALQ